MVIFSLKMENGYGPCRTICLFWIDTIVSEIMWNVMIFHNFR